MLKSINYQYLAKNTAPNISQLQLDKPVLLCIQQFSFLQKEKPKIFLQIIDR